MVGSSLGIWSVLTYLVYVEWLLTGRHSYICVEGAEGRVGWSVEEVWWELGAMEERAEEIQGQLIDVRRSHGFCRFLRV